MDVPINWDQFGSSIFVRLMSLLNGNKYTESEDISGMAKNSSMHNAKKKKNDEYYTEYEDIEKEMNAYHSYDENVFKDKTILCPCDDPEWSEFTKYFASRFNKLGLKKLICTSYAKSVGNKNTTDFEKNSPSYDSEKHEGHGKIFTLTKREAKKVNIDDLQWNYLEGDGDFRSDEVKKLRSEADIIVTNPPFSLFIDFVDWIMEDNKQFIIVGNKNAVTYENIFPLIRDNKIWIGMRSMNSDFWLRVPNGDPYEKINDKGVPVKHIMACWYTNIKHGKRFEDFISQCMTMEDNLQYNDKLIETLSEKWGCHEYPKYDNYDAIEVPHVIDIPSDYDGIMGVPITFLNNYNPEQYEIVGCNYSYGRPAGWNENISMSSTINGQSVFKRIFIKKKGGK